MACATGDFNGDGYDDIVAFNRAMQHHNAIVTSAGDVWVMRSNGTSFEGPERWAHGLCRQRLRDPKVGDFNGDGKDDIVVFVAEIWGMLRLTLEWLTVCGKSRRLDHRLLIRPAKTLRGGEPSPEPTRWQNRDDIARFTRSDYLQS